MHHHRSDYDFDVISGPSIRQPPPQPSPRPTSATPSWPRPADENEGGEEG